MDFKSFTNKISFGAGFCVLLTASVITVIAVLNLRSNMLQSAEDESIAVARAKVASIESSLNVEVQVASTLAHTLSAVKDNAILLDLRRDMVRGILRITLEKNPHIFGIYTCWEPDAFDYDDATGRLGVYAYQGADGDVEFLSLLQMNERAPGGVPGEWYSRPKKFKKGYLSEPFTTSILEEQKTITTITEPILANNTFYGVVGVDIDLDFLHELLDTNGGSSLGEKIMVITNRGMLASVSWDRNLIGQSLEAVHTDTEEDLALIQEGRETIAVMDRYFEMYIPIMIADTGTPWAVNVLAPLDKINAQAGKAMWKMIFIGIIGVVLALLVIRYMAMEMTGPLSSVVVLAGSLAKGDLTKRLNIKRDDEIGELSSALDESCESLSDMISDIRANAEMQAGASHEMSSVSSQLAATSEEMSAQSESVAGATEEMSASITSMASASEEMSVNIQSVSSTAEQMSQNMNTIAASIEEMSTTVEDVALSARDGSVIAQQAMEMSGTATMTMEVLGKAAKEIGEVTNLIKRIADQTNLLALNATIEAASAGDAGKGFAVVANEIKELANQSGQAANEISKRVEGVQGNTEQAVESIIGITDIIQRMNESSKVITTSVEEQTSTTLEISDSVQQATGGVNNIATSIAELARGANDVSKSAAEAARAVNEVSANIQGLSKAAGETNNGAQQVNSTAGELSRVAAQMRDLAARFKVITEELDTEDPTIG